MVMNLLMIWLTSDRHSWISGLLFDQYAIHGIPGHMVPTPHSFDLIDFISLWLRLTFFLACMCFKGKMNQHCGPLPQLQLAHSHIMHSFQLLTLPTIVFKDPTVNSALQFPKLSKL